MNNLYRNYKVFVSYNKKDKEIAADIAVSLEIEDITVWFDEWVTLAGDSIIDKIESGLKGCTHFIIIWSVNSAKSNWVRKELQSALCEAIRIGVPRIIPVILDKTPIPKLLVDLKYIRYKDDQEKDRGEIVKSILEEKPTQNLTKAVIKKYNELVYDIISNSPLPFRVCPLCGSNRLQRSSATDNEHDETYYSVKCKDCGWSDWTQ
jgi:predicted RNA-binding Zn-ribbon protein involved in translation (DUF1610 family)